MALFNNPNLIDHVIRSQKAQGIIAQSNNSTLQTIIELQTRKVIETAIKFMHNARRDVLKPEDIQLAVKDLHGFELGTGEDQKFKHGSQDIVNETEPIISAQQLLRGNIQLLQEYRSAAPMLVGKWILVKGVVPSTNDNIHLRCLSQLSPKEKEQAERQQLFNVIKDDPYSLLTKEQSDYFFKITNIIGVNPSPPPNFNIQGDLNNLLPFFLKYLGEKQLNLTGITFLIKLLNNKFIWTAVEYSLKKVLNLLLAYRGSLSYQVGVKIAQLVQRFEDKYPVLRDLFVDYQDQSYSTILKKIAFEVYLGIPLQMDSKMLAKCKQEAELSNEMAVLCLRTLLQHAGELSFLKEQMSWVMDTLVYWQPSSSSATDVYLTMF